MNRARVIEILRSGNEAVIGSAFHEACLWAATYIETMSDITGEKKPTGIPDDLHTRVMALESKIALLDQAIGKIRADAGVIK